MSGAVAEDDPEEYLTPGRVVAGKYRIERSIGSGGVGVVLAATRGDTCPARAAGCGEGASRRCAAFRRRGRTIPPRTAWRFRRRPPRRRRIRRRRPPPCDRHRRRPADRRSSRRRLPRRAHPHLRHHSSRLRTRSSRRRKRLAVGETMFAPSNATRSSRGDIRRAPSPRARSSSACACFRRATLAWRRPLLASTSCGTHRGLRVTRRRGWSREIDERNERERDVRRARHHRGIRVRRGDPSTRSRRRGAAVRRRQCQGRSDQRSWRPLRARVGLRERCVALRSRDGHLLPMHVGRALPRGQSEAMRRCAQALRRVRGAERLRLGNDLRAVEPKVRRCVHRADVVRRREPALLRERERALRRVYDGRALQGRASLRYGHGHRRRWAAYALSRV